MAVVLDTYCTINPLNPLCLGSALFGGDSGATTFVEGKYYHCDDDASIYLIEKAQKRPFASWAAYESLQKPPYAKANCSALGKVPLGAFITGPDSIAKPAAPPPAAPPVAIAPGCPAFPSQIKTVGECQSWGDQFNKCMGKTAGRTIQSGGWPHVPYGCSVQAAGDWAIHWNTDLTGPNASNAEYTLLGTGPGMTPVAPTNTSPYGSPPPIASSSASSPATTAAAAKRQQTLIIVGAAGALGLLLLILLIKM
jgi:hypothetical protein